jgi:hypothetical protein
MADWSSLPADLLTHIANCLLATNDVDCYMDFRAVCTYWRSATDDPTNSSELHFRPRRWIIIDEVFESDSRLMVNTVSGRVVRKDLPLLRRFLVVATTHGGFFVLADREPPHAACVLNPLTGHLIRFVAPMPPYRRFAAAVTGSSHTLFLLCLCCFEPQHMADPTSERFTWYGDRVSTYYMNRMAVEGGMYADGEHQGSVLAPINSVVADKIGRLEELLAPEFYLMTVDHYFLVEFVGEVFVVFRLQHRRKVFKVDLGRDVLEPVASLGNLTIFEGDYRCFAVDADKFPSVKANCVYYTEVTFSSVGIYMYDLKDEKEERICAPICALHPKFAYPPFGIIQLLSSYTNNVRLSQLVTQKWHRALSSEEEFYLSIIDRDSVDYQYD